MARVLTTDDIRAIYQLPPMGDNQALNGLVAVWNPETARTEYATMASFSNVENWKAKRFVFDPQFVVDKDGVAGTAGKVYQLSADIPYTSTDLAAEITAGDWEEFGAGNQFDFIKLNPQATPIDHEVGRIYYDEAENLFRAYNDLSDVGLDIGEEVWARVYNDTTYTFENGKVGSIRSAQGKLLLCDYTDATDIDSAIRCFGIFTQDIPPGEEGYIVRFGIIRSLNTTTCGVGDVIYASPTTPGDVTNVRPTAPNYAIRLGLCAVSDAINGAYGVDTVVFSGSDTSVNIEGALDGIVVHEPHVAFTVSGGVIYADISDEAHPTENLPFIIDGVRYELNTTTGSGAGGAARVVVPAGTASVRQNSLIYVYLDNGTPTLATGLASADPALAHCKIGYTSAYDAATTDTDDIFAWRRHNNAITLEGAPQEGSQGLLTEILRSYRDKLPSTWFSGQDATTTVNLTTVQIALTAGVASQFRRASTPLFDGTDYRIFNDASNNVVYTPSTNLIDIDTDASGGSLLSNNTYYTLRIYYQLNSNGVVDRVIATRPLGSYSTAELAITDPSNYNVQFNDTSIEQVVYPIYDMVIGRTSGALTLEFLRDKRTRLIGADSGGGGATGSGGLDELVRASATDATADYLNPKIAAGTGISKETLNPGANEQVQLSVDSTVLTYNFIQLSGSSGALNIDFDSKNVAWMDEVQSLGTATFSLVNDANARKIFLQVSASAAAVITFPLPFSALDSTDTRWSANVFTPGEAGTYYFEAIKSDTVWNVVVSPIEAEGTDVKATPFVQWLSDGTATPPGTGQFKLAPGNLFLISKTANSDFGEAYNIGNHLSNLKQGDRITFWDKESNDNIGLKINSNPVDQGTYLEFSYVNLETAGVTNLRYFAFNVIAGGGGSAYTEITPFDPALNFNSEKQYFAQVTQSGTIAFTLAGVSFGVGANVLGIILADGVNPITITDDFYDYSGFFPANSYTPNNGDLIDVYFLTMPDGKARIQVKNLGGGVVPTPPLITGYSGAGLNTYVDVNFSEGVYGANDGSTPVAVSDLIITNFTPGGATAISISSVTNTSDTALTGGETTIRCVLNITGTPDGTAEFQIQPVDSTSIYDAEGAAMDSGQTTGNIILQGALVDPVTLNPEYLAKAWDANGTGTEPTTDDIFTEIANVGTAGGTFPRVGAVNQMTYQSVAGEKYMKMVGPLEMIKAGQTAQPYTAVFVGEFETITETRVLWDSKGTATRSLCRAEDVSGDFKFRAYAGTFVETTPIIAANTTFVVSVVFDGVNTKINVNQTGYSTGDAGTGGFTDGLDIFEGGGGDPSGRLYGFFFKEAVVSDADITSVEEYFLVTGGVSV